MKKTKQKCSVDSLLYVLSLFFLIGICLGELAVYHSESLSLHGIYDINTGCFFDSLWRAAQFHILVCAAGVWSGGVILIPLIVLFRGYVLICAASVVGAEQAAMAWVICGLPAIVQLPSLLLIGSAGMRVSARLRDKVLSRMEILKQLQIGRVLMWSAVGVVLCACVDYYVVPALVTYLIS